jgi:hypothetical protein
MEVTTAALAAPIIVLVIAFIVGERILWAFTAIVQFVWSVLND